MLTILGSALGFATSIVPEVLGYFKQQQKDKQELALIEAKAKYATQLSELKINELEAKADISEIEGIYSEMKAANSESSFAAALSGSVRPIVTYLFVALFLAVKGGALYSQMDSGFSWNEAMKTIWDQETAALFAGVISFWFGHRAMQKIRTR
tara:strand:+ start:10864 stop:11322 length:459 start_codon:yes stop_codon:yes gene_type:complete